MCKIKISEVKSKIDQQQKKKILIVSDLPAHELNKTTNYSFI